MRINSLIQAVKRLNNRIHVKITDNYVSVSGDTFYVKGQLKLLGFRWNPKSREWYYSVKADDPEGQESQRSKAFVH